MPARAAGRGRERAQEARGDNGGLLRERRGLEGTADEAQEPGDGGLGLLWSGLSKVFPGCGRQFCWVNKMRDVRRYLPKSRHNEATRRLKDAYMSDTKAETSRKIDLLADGFKVKHPKAGEAARASSLGAGLAPTIDRGGWKRTVWEMTWPAESRIARWPA